MRIIGGAARGCNLAGPGKLEELRPTSDKVRQALFNMIEACDAALCDLFSGTGAVGAEAISRGSSSVTLVEQSRKAVAIINKNVAKVKHVAQSSARTQVVPGDALKFVTSSRGSRFDVIFCDPPYEYDRTADILKAVFANGMLVSGGLFILETSARKPRPEGFTPVKEKKYGDTLLLFYDSPPA